MGQHPKPSTILLLKELRDLIEESPGGAFSTDISAILGKYNQPTAKLDYFLSLLEAQGFLVYTQNDSELKGRLWVHKFKKIAI